MSGKWRTWFLACCAAVTAIAVALLGAGFVFAPSDEVSESSRFAVTAESSCAYVVSGIVNFLGEPVEGATVEFRRYRRTGTPHRVARTDSFGRFSYAESGETACFPPDRYLTVTRREFDESHPYYRYDYRERIGNGEQVEIELASNFVLVH